MNKENLEKALRLFVSKDQHRQNLLNPFKQDGYYFATEGHMLMMVKENNYNLDFNEQDKPHVLKVVPKDRHEPIVLNVAEFEKKLDDATPMVNETKECYHCGGEGSQTCDLNHEHECERCDGEGEIVAHPPKLVKDRYCNYKMMGGYINRSKLTPMFGACKLLGIETVNKVWGQDNRPYLFENGDVMFLIMPILKPMNFVVINI